MTLNYSTKTKSRVFDNQLRQPMTSQELAKCEYLKEENCHSISSNDEGKAIRNEFCSNENKTACCYLCPFSVTCEVSCSFLGEKKCPSCHSETQKAKMNLRVDGMTGQWMLKSGDFFDFSRQVLPIIAYFCPRCNKLEFFVEDKAKTSKAKT